MTISERFKYVRVTLSHADFAAELGIHKNSVGSYERGETKPDIEFLGTLCAKLDVDPRGLILGVGNMREEREKREDSSVLVPIAPWRGGRE